MMALSNLHGSSLDISWWDFFSRIDKIGKIARSTSHVQAQECYNRKLTWYEISERHWQPLHEKWQT